MTHGGRQVRHLSLPLTATKTLSESANGHVVFDCVVRNKCILPTLFSGCTGVLAGERAPLHAYIALRFHLFIFHFVGGFRFKHIDTVAPLSYKVWLIFKMIWTPFVKELKLSFARPEPF